MTCRALGESGCPRIQERSSPKEAALKNQELQLRGQKYREKSHCQLVLDLIKGARVNLV